MPVESLRTIETVEDLAMNKGGSLPRPAGDDAALLQYTSGSTGDPKGVLLTHTNILANIRAMGTVIAPTTADVFVSWLPLYHDLGLIGAWLGSLYYGVPLVVMSPLRFLVRPEQWLWTIHRHRGTLSAAPNFAFELCLRKVADETLEGLDLSGLRMVANGAEPVNAETVRSFTKRFARWGFRPEAMAPVYGLAENGVGLAFPPLGRRPVIDRIDRRALGRAGRAVSVGEDIHDALEVVACGHPLPGHQVRIRGPTGELGERQEGGLQFRGPSATSDYFRNPDKNHELFDGEWLNSGDLAYIAGGDIFITGRSKDIVIRAGQHIYPHEIEETVGGVPGVRKGCVAVFGATDPRAGTERLIVLAETRETDPPRRAEIRSRIEEATARLLQAPPEEIILAPPHTVPKTSSGKIRRAAAREFYERGTLRSGQQALWRQFMPLALAASGARLRVAGRALLEYFYNVYWWIIMVALGSIAWPLVLVLPDQARRWNTLHALSRLALKMGRLPLSVENAGSLPDRAILASNHASYIDNLVLAAALPGKLAFVAKKDLARQRVAGPFLRALGTIFVERDDPRTGIEDVRAVLAAAKAGHRVIFFPEGTFSRAPGLLPFRLGAFSVAIQASLPVVPVAIRGTRSVLRGGQWFARQGTITVHLGKPVTPEGQDFGAILRLRDAARTAILAKCGEPEATPI